jgi:hypothetical protein
LQHRIFHPAEPTWSCGAPCVAGMYSSGGGFAADVEFDFA